MNLFCVGVSHHNTDVEARERVAADAGVERLLREENGCSEALLLTTCNRVEIYGIAPGAVPTPLLSRCMAAGDSPVALPEMYRHDDSECVQHLFRVASGLDSMVVGETEIFGQVKKAYETARVTRGAGPHLHRLFQRAFRVAKQVRTHTQITRGSTSVGSVAVDLAQRIFGDLRTRRVLILGAGETSERTARALVSRGVQELFVSNRSPERAQQLALQVNARPVPFDDWHQQCAKIDILITSTSSEEPLVSREMLIPFLAERVERPLFIIDIAVPRDVDPSVNELDGVYLYDIDSLKSIAEQSIAQRRQQIAAAEKIIAEHVRDFWAKLFANESSQRHQTGDGFAPISASDV